MSNVTDIWQRAAAFDAGLPAITKGEREKSTVGMILIFDI